MDIETTQTALADRYPIDADLLDGSYVEQDSAQLILNALPEACRNCTRARLRVEHIAWAVEMGNRASAEKIAGLIREQTGCIIPISQ